MKSKVLTIMLLLASTNLFANCFKGFNKHQFKEVKQGNPHDTASSYGLTHAGVLMRCINDTICSVTNNVSKFKISQHQSDKAVVYYQRKNKNKIEELHMLIKPNKVPKGQCPQKDERKLLTHVKKFHVVPFNDSQFMTFSLSSYGLLSFIDKNFVPNEAQSIDHSIQPEQVPTYVKNNPDQFPLLLKKAFKNYVINPCYKKPGKSHSQYIAFAITNEGTVLKLRAQGNLHKTVDDKKFNTIKDFMQINKISCN